MIKRAYITTIPSIIASICWAWAPSAIAQSGGNFSLTQSVIASGGETAMTGGSFSLGGTAGQSFAGTVSTGGNYFHESGFWNYFLAPTAATTSIEGRVLSSSGIAVFRARVVFTGMNGESRSTVTNQFGWFRIDGATVGETYIISVTHKELQFAQQLVTVIEDVHDLEITASN